MEVTKMFQQLLLACALLITGWPSEFVSAETETKISGGTPVKQGEYKYQALIRCNGVFICGGSILNRDTILTAASCVDDYRETPNKYAVVVGERNKDIVEGIEQAYVAMKIIIKDGYNAETYDSDLAVIILQENMEFNSNVNNIRLPEPGATWYFGKEATATGWGDGNQAMLQFDKGQVLPLDQQQNCNSQIVKSGMICATSKACSGDVGGPLVVYATDGNPVQVGIASRINACSESPTQGLFTKVGEYTTWIDSQTGDIDISKGAGHVIKLSMVLVVLTVAIALFA